MSEQNSTPPPPWFCRIVIGLVSMVSIAGGGIVAFFAIVMAMGRLHHLMEMVWSVAGILVGLLPIASGCAAIAFLFRRAADSLRLARILFLAAICGMAVLMTLGFLVIKEAERIGGDWAGLSIIVDGAICVVIPGIIAGLSATALACLKRAKRYL